MRGPYQEARRIPHTLQELPNNPDGNKWQVTLLPHDSEPIKCNPGKCFTTAFENAGQVLRTRFPGATL